MARELAGISVITLKARDADTLLDAALAVKAAMPSALTPEVSPMWLDAELDLWSVTVRTRRGLVDGALDDFTQRRPMSYRQTLRAIPKPLRRQWLQMRYRYRAPRIEIGCAYLLTPE